MIIIGVFILGAYVACLGAIAYGFLKVKSFSTEKTSEQTAFSIIIPFRNEAEVLPRLLSSLEKINYPSELFEIIFVDDASEDDSVKIIREKLNLDNWRIISNNRSSNAPKKDAITTAVKVAKYEWIVTTDADCAVAVNWLKTIDAFILKKDPVLIAGPVLYSADRSMISQFQLMDGLSLQATTVGSFGLYSPMMCNGANLAYKKSAFQQLNGFDGNNHIASGDDVFMLEKIRAAFPKKISYLNSREAIVSTMAQGSWKKLIEQRIRWASKTSNQKNWKLKTLGLVVFLANLFVVIAGIWSLFQPIYTLYFLAYLIIKIVVDYLIISLSTSFLKAKVNALIYLVNSLLYPIIILVVVLSSFNGSYTWKGRKFQKSA